MHEHPLKTNAVTTGALCALGDVLAQLYERRALRRPPPPPPGAETGGRVAANAADERAVGARSMSARSESDGAARGGEGGAGDGGAGLAHTAPAGFQRRLSTPVTDDEAAAALSYSPMRTLRNLVFGLAVGGPLYSLWYRTLDVVSKAAMVSYEPLVPALGWLSTRFPGVGKGLEQLPVLSGLYKMKKEVPQQVDPRLIVAAKVMADGMVANPIFLHAYFATIGLLEGRRPREILDHTKAQFHRAWGLALVVWTPVQIINFSVLPVHFQAAFVSVVNVGWKMTLSLVPAGPASPPRPRTHASSWALNPPYPHPSHPASSTRVQRRRSTRRRGWSIRSRARCTGCRPKSRCSRCSSTTLAPDCNPSRHPPTNRDRHCSRSRCGRHSHRSRRKSFSTVRLSARGCKARGSSQGDRRRGRGMHRRPHPPAAPCAQGGRITRPRPRRAPVCGWGMRRATRPAQQIGTASMHPLQRDDAKSSRPRARGKMVARPPSAVTCW